MDWYWSPPRPALEKAPWSANGSTPASPPIPTAWLSLEEADNDPVRFWEYFIAALKTIQPTIGETSLRLLHSSERGQTESVLAPLINDIAAFSGDFILVLDDYHFIQSAPVHQGLTFFLEHMPPRMHLVIATRVEPPLPLAHFRGKGTLLEIGVDDLRFSQQEAAGLLGAIDIPELSAENVSALNTRAGGWATGLKMAALSMRGEKDIPAFIATFTGSQRYVMDYLIEEVLQRQSPETRDFLLRTSVLERLNGPLCDAVTGRNNGSEILLKLESENLFVAPLDRSQEWYRYEHLFADLLRHRLELESGKGVAEELHNKASHWYEENGFRENAVNHALAARDWARALDLMLNLAPNLIDTYGAVATYNWLRLVPEEILLTRPRACRYYTFLLNGLGHYNAAKTFLDRFEKAEAGNIASAGYIAAERTYIARAQDDPRTEEYARKALALLPQDEFLERASVSSGLGLYYQARGRFRESEPILTEAYDLFRKSANDWSAIFPLLRLALTKIVLRGELRRAEEMSREVAPYAGRPTGPAVLGLIRYERNDLESAAAEFEKAIALSAGNPLNIGSFTAQIVPTRLAQGNVEAAAKASEEAERLLIRDGVTAPTRALFAGCRIAVAEAQGDDEAISRWLDTFSDYEGFLGGIIPTSTIRLLREQGGEKGKRRLAALYEMCRKEGLRYYLIIERIDQAITSSQPDEGLSFLADALAMGKPEGFIHIFVDWGISLAPLLRLAISRGVEPQYARKLLDIIEAEDRQRRIRRGEIPASSGAGGLLSERELEVLRLVAEGLSNQQIAAKLMISLNTTKTHVRHIFDKLDAKDRLQAVTRAKELKLI